MFLKEFMFNITELGGLEMRLEERSNERLRKGAMKD